MNNGDVHFMRIMEMFCAFHANNGDDLNSFIVNNGVGLCISCE